MKFRTEIPLSKEHNQIDHKSEIVLFGSCFSENIYQKLNYYKFPCTGNPFGILYNPIAIEKLIGNSINEYSYSEDDLFELNEQWHCFDAHSDLSAPQKNDILSNLNKAVQDTGERLKNASHVVITLGTAWVYRFIETDAIVGNCHKIPQKKFLKELLSVKKIIASLENSIALIRAVNPTVNVLLTVSPVRHLKDGFAENNRSKSHLITAIHEVVDNRARIYYFPSYEIMMDDLRDYRYFAEDLVHPNTSAINYIWDKFKESWIAESSYTVMGDIEAVRRDQAHRPFNPNSDLHRQFLNKLDKKIENLKQNHGIRF